MSTEEFQAHLSDYVVSRERGFLMKDPSRITTILCASNVKSAWCVRPELRTPEYVFKPISTKELLGKLARLPANVSRAQMAEVRGELLFWQRMFYREIREREKNVDGAFDRFLSGSAVSVRAKFGNYIGVPSPNLGLLRKTT